MCHMHADAESCCLVGTASSTSLGAAKELVWYGQTYKCEDVHEAHAFPADPTDAAATAAAVDSRPGMTSRRQHENLWPSPYWQPTGSHTHSVLQHLCHCRSYIYMR